MKLDKTVSPKTRAADDGSKTRLVIVTDLGHLRAYRLQQDNLNSPRLEAIAYVQTEVSNHLSRELTDQPGRFRKAPAVAGAMSDGQEHNLSLERRKRAVKILARHISDLIKREKPDGCYLAADSRIHEPLVEHLDKSARNKIEKNIHANLSNLSEATILKKIESGKVMAKGAQTSERPTSRKSYARDSQPTKKRSINKVMDSRFAMRNQHESLAAGTRRGKSTMDLADTPRRRKTARGPRRTQLGRTLRQGELAKRDPVRI